MRSVNGKYGEIWFYGKDLYVGRSLYNYGEFSAIECDKILELSGKGLCLDIGANVGVMSQMLSEEGKSVIAFEPQPEIFKLLQMNFRGTAHCCALGSSEGIAKMPRVRYGTAVNYGGLGIGDHSVLGSIEVPMHTLDSYNFDNVSFIKLDVEGYELEVLKGAVKLLENWAPILYVEDDRAEKSLALRRFIMEQGYKIEEHVTPLYNPDNFFGLKKNIWDKNYVSKNLICSK